MKHKSVPPFTRTYRLSLFRESNFFVVRYILIGLATLLLSGCGIASDSPNVHDYLNLNWPPGRKWTVKYRIWPDRKTNPRTRESREISRTIRFRVGEREGSRKIVNAVDLSNRNRFRLTFGNEFNLLEVNRIVDEKRNSVAKLKRIMINPLENTAMFHPNGDPSVVAPWFFPDLSVTMNQPRKRLNYDIRSSSSEKWMIQELETHSGELIFTIIHEPRQTRAIFRWRRGEPWWYRFRWYKSRRIVAEGRRLYRQ